MFRGGFTNTLVFVSFLQLTTVISPVWKGPALSGVLTCTWEKSVCIMEKFPVVHETFYSKVKWACPQTPCGIFYKLIIKKSPQCHFIGRRIGHLDHLDRLDRHIGSVGGLGLPGLPDWPPGLPNRTSPSHRILLGRQMATGVLADRR